MLNVLINTHLLQAAKSEKLDRFFFASSACVYNEEKQKSVDVMPLKEEDAYPAMPEDGYGWEKLFQKECAATLQKTLDWSLAWRGFTMCTDRTDHSTMVEKRLRQQFVAKSMKQNRATFVKLKSGVTVRKHAVLPTLTIALKAY